MLQRIIRPEIIGDRMIGDRMIGENITDHVKPASLRRDQLPD